MDGYIGKSVRMDELADALSKCPPKNKISKIKLSIWSNKKASEVTRRSGMVEKDRAKYENLSGQKPLAIPVVEDNPSNFTEQIPAVSG